jgi:hypothetical protein
VASTPSPNPQSLSSILASPWIILKLALLSFLSLAPILARERLRSLIDFSVPASASITHKGSFPTSAFDEHVVSRWTWINDWRSRFRLPSQALTREASRKELEVLVQEKIAGLPS